MEVGIVGLGRIGVSLGLELHRLGYQVMGVSRQEQTCQIAVTCEAVDQACTNLASLATADIIFICTPIDAIQPTVEQLIPHLHLSTILTDVSPVKASITRAISALWPNFIGGHPMIIDTGKNGISAAQLHLFTGIPYILTPLETTPIGTVNIVRKMAQSLGSQVYCCLPEVHDHIVALFHQLPFFANYSLIAACLNKSHGGILELFQQLTSSNLITSNHIQDYLCESNQLNQSELLQILQENLNNLDQMIGYIEQEDWNGLEQYFIQIQHAYSEYTKSRET